MKSRLLMTLFVAFGLAAAGIASAGVGQQAVLNQYTALAKAADPGFAGFSAQRGKSFFLASHGVKADTPSCSTCHTSDPTRTGKTTVGKTIAPMAVSVTPGRFTDIHKTEKWFRRNCNTVLGRQCTPAEKGDFISFMVSR